VQCSAVHANQQHRAGMMPAHTNCTVITCTTKENKVCVLCLAPEAGLWHSWQCVFVVLCFSVQNTVVAAGAIEHHLGLIKSSFCLCVGTAHFSWQHLA
jgi:hypothetical protein